MYSQTLYITHNVVSGFVILNLTHTNTRRDTQNVFSQHTLHLTYIHHILNTTVGSQRRLYGCVLYKCKWCRTHSFIPLILTEDWKTRKSALMQTYQFLILLEDVKLVCVSACPLYLVHKKGRGSGSADTLAGHYRSQALTYDTLCHFWKVTSRWSCCWRIKDSSSVPIIAFHGGILPLLFDQLRLQAHGGDTKTYCYLLTLYNLKHYIMLIGGSLTCVTWKESNWSVILGS